MTTLPKSLAKQPDGRLNPWATHTVRVCEVKTEIENVKTMRLAIENEQLAGSFQFLPGQFNMLYMPGAGEAAISISGDPASNLILDHTIRVAGDVTTGVCDLQVGDTLGLRGPFGRGWPMSECEGRDVIMVTGGIGLPPLRPVIYEVLREREKFGQLNLLYGARSPDDLLFAEQYEDWSNAGINVQLTVDRSAPGWQGSVGVVTLLMDRLQTFDPANTVLLCCGPEIMMRFVARKAMERGITAEQIWVSTERNMNCAIGLCGHCQLGGSFICKDGPVFRYDQIGSYLNIHGL